MARGVDGRDIFVVDIDREEFLAGLRAISKASGAVILAYCLMGNHFHIAIQVASIRLSAIVQRMLTAYVLSFNRRHGRTGHLFQARYKAVICTDERYLAMLVRYIHLNPVRVGWVARPEDWRWSSVGTTPDRAINEADWEEFDPWPKDLVQRISLNRELALDSLDIELIGAKVAAQTDISIEDMKSRSCRRTIVAARRLLAKEAWDAGLKMIDVARWLNVAPSSMTRYCAK